MLVFPVLLFFSSDFSNYVYDVEKRMAVNWVTLLLYIRGVADSNLSPEALGS
jgi:hypothetical protein